MKFTLNCTLVLSKDPKIGVDDILKGVSEILEKGAPKGEGAKIESRELKGNELILKITSGKYTRPHDVVFRIKNFLAKELGKKYHLGVKSISADTYTVDFQVDSEPVKEIKIPFATLEFKGRECRLILKNLDEDFLQKNYVDRMINLVIDKVIKQQFGAKSEHHEIVYVGKEREPKYDKDPSIELLNRHWIKRTSHRNQFIFGAQITELAEALKRAIVDNIYEPLGFVEMIFPKIESFDIWKKSGHLYSIYQGGFNPYLFITPKSASPEEWEEIADFIKITNEIPKEKFMSMLDFPTGGLSFAQCPAFWPYLESATIAEESLPIKVFDWSGPTYRYESGGAHGFERVDELHRIETLWVGSKEQVIEITDLVRKKFRYLFEDVLELKMREAWVTPWFMAQQGLVELDREKTTGTVDFEAILPYKKEWLEVQNCSNNGNKYPKAFNVKSQKKELFSGCAGGSFERYLSAFLAQKGFNQDDWSKSFRKYIKEIPKGVKFL